MGSHVTTLGPKYISYSYMEPVGKGLMQCGRVCGVAMRPRPLQQLAVENSGAGIARFLKMHRGAFCHCWIRYLISILIYLYNN